MAKGRKPKADAIKRAKAREVVEATVVDGSSLPMPESVALNPAMRECWDLVVYGNAMFAPADLPMIESLCTFYAMLKAAQLVLNEPDGSMRILELSIDGSIVRSPAIAIVEKASVQIRLLSEALGVGPLARSRMNLNNVATARLAADIPKQIRELLDAQSRA